MVAVDKNNTVQPMFRFIATQRLDRLLDRERGRRSHTGQHIQARFELEGDPSRSRRMELDNAQRMIGAVHAGRLAKATASFEHSLGRGHAHPGADSIRTLRSSSAVCRIFASARRFTKPGSGTSMSTDT